METVKVSDAIYLSFGQMQVIYFVARACCRPTQLYKGEQLVKENHSIYIMFNEDENSMKVIIYNYT